MHRDRFFLYEIGSVYNPVQNGCDQPVHLSGVGYRSDKLGSIQDLFLTLKGTVSELFEIVNTGQSVFELSKDTSKPWYGMNSTMGITVNGTKAGYIGYLSNPFIDVYEKGTQVVWFELTVDAVTGHAYPDTKYENIAVIPDRGWTSRFSPTPRRFMPIWLKHSIIFLIQCSRGINSSIFMMGRGSLKESQATHSGSGSGYRKEPWTARILPVFVMNFSRFSKNMAFHSGE